MKEEIVKLTAAAADRMKTIIAERDKPAAGIRLTVSTKGCSGMSYNLDYADEKTPSDGKRNRFC
jgi:iron-sulfur cluster assembly protein